MSEPVRLHVGSGSARIEGWINVDREPLPGVDVVADVTRGLRFSNVSAVYAEHFLEHLRVDLALDFLLELRRVLRPDGWLRLSTPNLDWVWATHYRLEADADTKRAAAWALNRAFHGWGHRFLWNRECLHEALAACGFDGLRDCHYGASALDVFRGIERHEVSQDTPDLPHVLIVEAQPGDARPARLEALRARLRRDFLDHLAPEPHS